MSFTDDDLTRLKAHLQKLKGALGKDTVVAMPDAKHISIDSLVARLEAAEKFCNGVSTGNPEEIRLWREWRKAAGK